MTTETLAGRRLRLGMVGGGEGAYIGGDTIPESELATRLDPRHFARVHRSAIINVRRVKAIHPWFNGHHVVTMDTGQQLRMSRYQHEAFLKLVSTRRED